jgi:hypothetical protein
MIGICREHSSNVKRWRDGQMALRWCAAGMVEAGKQFRRVNGHLDLRALRAALDRHVATTPRPDDHRPPPEIHATRDNLRIEFKITYTDDLWIGVKSASNVEVHRFIDHGQLMPDIDMMIVHGEHGTTMGALGHDLLLMLPLHPMCDQPASLKPSPTTAQVSLCRPPPLRRRSATPLSSYSPSRLHR